MKTESGRSLIEVVGVLVIGTLMAAAAIGTYATVRNNQMRNIAAATLEQIASDVKLLMELRGDYTGVSVDYLIKAGALKNDDAPLGGDTWSITAPVDGKSFSINLVGLSSGECGYFSVAKPQWATRVEINGYSTDGICLSSGGNQISFIVE